MDLTINTYEDLLSIVNTNVEWRRKLVKALFPEIDVPKALQELAEAQRQTQEGLRVLSEAQRRTEEALLRLEAIVAENSRQLVRLDMRVERLEEKVETGFTEAAADRQAIKQRLDGMDNTLKELKGDSYEGKIRDRAAGVFGRYVKRGRDMTNEIGEKLDEAEDNGLISELEGERVLAVDLLWGGKLKAIKENVVLVVELSWWAEQNDVDRAVNRAAILRRIGVTALPVVGGNNGWAEGLPEIALQKGVVMMTGMRFDKASWKVAIDAIS